MKRGQDGFTLIELIIVVAIIGILAAIAGPQFRDAPKRAREAVLKSDLHTLRESIDQYFADKGQYPDSLQTLVEEGYLRKVPEDPFTRSSSTWVYEYAEQGEDSLAGDDGMTGPGIFDVKSGSDQQALDGTYVAEW